MSWIWEAGSIHYYNCTHFIVYIYIVDIYIYIHIHIYYIHIHYIFKYILYTVYHWNSSAEERFPLSWRWKSPMRLSGGRREHFPFIMGSDCRVSVDMESPPKKNPKQKRGKHYFSFFWRYERCDRLVVQKHTMWGPLERQLSWLITSITLVYGTYNNS